MKSAPKFGFGLFLSAIFSALVLGISASFFPVQALQHWVQVNHDGFDEVPVGTLANYVSDVIVYREELYAATQFWDGIWSFDDSRIYKYDDDIELGGNTWVDTMVGNHEFGDPNNSAIYDLIEYEGDLYASTSNYVDGAEIWKLSHDVWSLVEDGGFGGADNTEVRAMVVYGDNLYVSVTNAALGGGQVWRYDGSSWVRILHGYRNWMLAMAVYNDELYFAASDLSPSMDVMVYKYDWVNPAIPSSAEDFGNSDNELVNCLYVFEDKLYATTNNPNGTEVWVYDGVSWTTSGDVSDFGADNFNSMLWGYNGRLYLATANYSSGSELWVLDGASWIRLENHGIIDPNNIGSVGDSMEFATFENRMVLGLTNVVSGIEVLMTYDKINLPTEILPFVDPVPGALDSLVVYLSNDGPDHASNVRVFVNLSVGMDYNGVSAGWTCLDGGSVVNCTLDSGEIPAFGTSQLVLSVTMPSTPGDYTVQAQTQTDAVPVDPSKLSDTYTITLREPPPFEPPTPLTPSMNYEPEYSSGTSNTVSWTAAEPDMMYYVQASRGADFSVIEQASGWVGYSSYSFSGLADGVTYYYRVVAKNEYEVEGLWSNIVYSTQDATAPETSVTTALLDDEEIRISVGSFDAVSGVANVYLYYTKDGKGEYPLGAVVNGLAVVAVEDLLGDGRYCFFTVGNDNVGNSEARGIPTKCVVIQEPGDVVTPPVDDGNGGGEDGAGEAPETFQEVVETVVAAVSTYIEEHKTEVIIATSVPAAVGVVSTASTIGFSFLDVQSYMTKFVLWLLGLVGYKPKTKKWGFVYDSITKQPVARAVVRLFAGDSLVGTDVTDVNGVFYFMPKPGTYRLTINRSGFVFPSRVILGSVDGVRTNLYRGGDYKVTEDEQVLNISVPVDPVAAGAGVSVFRKILSSLQTFIIALNPYLLAVGTILSLVSYLISGGVLNLVLFLLNVLLLVLHFVLRRSAESRWGKVVDLDGSPIVGVEVGLYEPKYNKLIDTRVTDEKGRFSFVVVGGMYYLRPVGAAYTIAETSKPQGYLVGRETGDDILITENMILRSVASG